MSILPESDEVAESSPQDLPIHNPKFNPDPEKQQRDEDAAPDETKTSVYKSLGWLDRFLAVWIFLAMAVGIILGAFVPNVGPALQKKLFVGVSVPIGEFCLLFVEFAGETLMENSSYWPACHDVSHFV